MLNILSRATPEEDLIPQVLQSFADKHVDILANMHPFQRRIILGQDKSASSSTWTYKLETVAWLAAHGKIEEGFGQTQLRDKPSFYLFTRYLVVQRSSGSVHTFRVKHNHSVNLKQSGLIYNQKSQEDFTRPDTAGYLLWLLELMYTQ